MFPKTAPERLAESRAPDNSRRIILRSMRTKRYSRGWDAPLRPCGLNLPPPPINLRLQESWEARKCRVSMDVRNGFLEAIGNTPLIRLKRASERPAARSSARPSSSTPAAPSRTGRRFLSSATPRSGACCGRAA